MVKNVFKTVFKTVSKTVSKPLPPPNSERNGGAIARPVKRHTPQAKDPYRRCAYGLANVMRLRQIHGAVAGMERGARHFQIGIKLCDPTMSANFAKRDIAEAIALATRSKAVLIRRDYGRMLIEFELSSKFWEFYDRSSVDGLGIGLATRKRQVSIEFDDAKSQCLIVGSTGSGKTIAIQSALLAMMQQFSPNDAKFVIVDPDKDHGEFDNEAHLMLPIAQSDDQIAQALTKTNNLLEHRHSDNIRDDYQVVVLIDEITELITRRPELYDVIASLTNGRKFKINVVAAAHRITKDDLPGKDKFTQRYIGKLGSPGDNFPATGMQGLEAHKLSGQGDFYHIANTDVTRFQVAMPRQSDFSRLDRAEPQQMAFDDLEVSPRFIEETTARGGAPKAKIAPATVADYLQYPKLSVRKGQGLGYGRTTHNLNKQFAADLMVALNSRNLTICNEEDCHE
jgi:hypothetical protein